MENPRSPCQAGVTLQTGLTGEARKRALDRFHLLQPHLENDRPLKAVAAAAGIPFRTAQRWVSLDRQFGLAALARRKRTDTGKHREISAELKEAIEGLALQKPPLPIATICRQARRLAQDLGEESPSCWLVYRIVTALPADLLTLAHEGTEAYSNAFELVHRRAANASSAIRQADHTPLDILLIRPDGELAKPWLTTVIGDYSRAVAGYFLSFEDPSALHTSLALRQAIWRKEDSRWVVCGIPDLLYTDKGSDFTSQHFMPGLEFRPLAAQEIRQLLDQRWVAPGVHLPTRPLDPGDGRGDHPNHRWQLPVAESSTHADGTNSRNQRSATGDQNGCGRGSREPGDWAGPKWPAGGPMHSTFR